MTHDDRKFRPWYTPDTARWLRLSLAARGLVAELLRKWDDRGEIRAESAEDIAILLRLSVEEIAPALEECITHGRLEWDDAAGVLRDPGFQARQRRSSAERMRDKRRRDAERVTDVTPRDASDVTPVTDIPVTGRDVTSPLLSSDLISSSSLKGEHERELWTLDAPLPDRWRKDAVAQVERSPETVDIDDQWRRYLSDRLRPEQVRLVSSADWRGWILKAISFAKSARMDESDKRERQRERDAKFGKRYGDHTPKYDKPTQGQASNFQAELKRRLEEDAKKGAA